MKNSGKKILVVEDDADVRVVTANILMEIGYEVMEAATGEEALELLRQPNNIKVVFSDIVMPGHMDGYDLAREISTLPNVPNILLTSGYPQKVKDLDSPSNKEIRLISKPYTSSELAQALAEVMGQAAAG